MTTVQPPADITAVLALSDERDAWMRRLVDWYRAGLEHGHARGYADAEADMARRWDEITRPVARGRPFAELEERRWGPEGREHFGDPRPGDYPGKAAAWTA